MMPDIIITKYSLFSSVLFFTVVTLLIVPFRKSTKFIVDYGIQILFAASIFTVVRLILPVDLYWAKVIPLDILLNPLIRFLKFHVIGSYTIQVCLCFIWALGTVAFLSYYIYVTAKDMHFLDRMSCVENTELDEARNDCHYPNMKVKVSPYVDMPKTWGISTAHIYLPELTLSSEEWSYVLAHEIQHIRNHDTWIKGLMLTIAALFWWNPAVHMLRKEMDHILELRCDASLTQGYTQAECELYLKTILKVLQQISPNSSKSWFMASLVSNSAYDVTKQRFEIIMAEQPSRREMRRYWYVLLALLFLASYFVIFQPGGEPENANLYESAQSTFILHTKDNKYSLYMDGTFYKELSKDALKDSRYSEIEIIEED